MGNHQAEKLAIETTQSSLPEDIVENLKNKLYHFESSYIQRIKTTPFRNADMMHVPNSETGSNLKTQNARENLIFVDPVDLPISALIKPRMTQGKNPN